MSRESYDRARAEYIKSHSRAERLELAYILAGRISQYIDGRTFFSFRYFGDQLERYGYDIKQVDALSESIKEGLTGTVIHKHHRFVYNTLETIAISMQNKNTFSEAYNEAKERNFEKRGALQSNPAMVLRAAFRELEHALINLPRTTETVADATHSS